MWAKRIVFMVYQKNNDGAGIAPQRHLVKARGSAKLVVIKYRASIKEKPNVAMLQGEILLCVLLLVSSKRRYQFKGDKRVK